MGFFSDIRTIKQQSDEMRRDWNPGFQMDQAMAQMQAVSAGMAQSAALLDPHAEGVVDGQVQLTTVGHAAGMLNGAPLVTVSALVMLPGRPPMPGTSNVPVPVNHTHQLQVGATLPARVSSTDPSAFVINWAAASTI